MPENCLNGFIWNTQAVQVAAQAAAPGMKPMPLGKPWITFENVALFGVRFARAEPAVTAADQGQAVSPG